MALVLGRDVLRRFCSAVGIRLPTPGFRRPQVLQGELQETRYQWPTDQAHKEGMLEVCRTRLPLDGVCYINGDYTKHRLMRLSNFATVLRNSETAASDVYPGCCFCSWGTFTSINKLLIMQTVMYVVDGIYSLNSGP